MESMSKQTNNVLNYKSFNRYISLLFQICIALFWGTILSILISRNKNVNMTINELKYETFLTLD